MSFWIGCRTVMGAAVGGIMAVAGGSVSAGTLTLGHTTWVGYGTLYLARDLGYFKDLGLDLQLKNVDDSAITLAAQAGGQMDGGAVTLDEILKYRSPDFCVKSVLAVDDSHGGDGMVAEDSIKGLEDLKGKEVALNEGSTSEFWFRYLLKQKGIDSKSITITNMTADAAAAAFIAKRVPAAVTWEPNLTFVKTNKAGKVLVDSSSTPGVIIDVVELNCAVIDKQPNDVKALAQGVFKAVEYLKAHQKEAYEIMAKGVGGYLSKPEDFADAAKGVNFYGKAENAAYFGTPDKPGTAAATTIKLGAEIWGEQGKIKMPVDYPTMVDARFIN